MNVRPVPPGRPDETVWVLDDPRSPTAAEGIGIAERLGVPFRRVPLTWNWMAHLAALSRRGSLMGLAGATSRPAGGAALLAAEPGPALVISAGGRAAAVALWLKARFGCRIVHCARTRLGALMRGDAYDLLVILEHDQSPAAANVLPVLVPPHRISPLLLRQAAAAWEERQAHLPHPRVALLVGGPVRGTDMQPALAHALGRKVAGLTAQLRGSVLASTSRRTGGEATDALAAGLARSLHVLYRWGEPGANPYLGFLATADAIVVTADSASMLGEACATRAPVYVALPELAGLRQRRLIASLTGAGQVRSLASSLAPWPRTELDEAGRVAGEILRRFPLD